MLPNKNNNIRRVTMKNLKSVLAALVIAVAGAVVSTPAFAQYPPEQAIDMTVAKIQTAIDAMKSGANAEAVSDLIKDALDATKEINASDSVFVARTKGSNILKTARKHLKEGSTKEAEQELDNAFKAFSNLKKLL
jgi:Tfp pilus assembly protein PilF